MVSRYLGSSMLCGYTYAAAIVVPVETETPAAVTITPTVQGGRTRTIKKTGGTDTTWGDASAYIDQPLTGDFRVNYSNPDVTKTFAVGLVANPTASNSYTDFDGLAHELTAVKDITAGAIGGVSLATGANGEAFGIGRIGDKLVRWRNGVEFGTRRTISTGTLYFDSSIYSSNGQIDDVDPDGDESEGAFNGALVYNSGGASGAGDAFDFTAEAYDFGDWHTGSGDQLIVPAGVSFARFKANMTDADGSSFQIHKNGAAFIGSALGQSISPGASKANGVTAIVPVSPGQVFTVVANYLQTAAADSWFSAEAIPATRKRALVRRTTTAALGTGVAAVAFEQAVYDTDGFFNPANPTRLSVPVGVSLVRISTCLQHENTSASVSSNFQLFCRKNGSGGFPGSFAQDHQRHTINAVQGVSAILAVVGGTDYFEITSAVSEAHTLQAGNFTWFQMEEVGAETKYCLVYKVATQAISAATHTAVTFGAGSEDADTSGFHDTVTNPSRLTIPPGLGITQARLTFGLVGASTVSGQLIGYVRKNGTASLPGQATHETEGPGAEFLNGDGEWVDVVPGDYFELYAYSDSAQTLPINSSTFLCIETR